MSIPGALGFDDHEVVGGGGDGGLNEKSSKSKKPPALEHAFIFLRLVSTDIRIETEADYFLGKWFLEMLDTKLTMQTSWPCLGFQDLGSTFKKLTGPRLRLSVAHSLILYCLPPTIVIVILSSRILFFPRQTFQAWHSARYASECR